jgi:hypothetical protein
MPADALDTLQRAGNAFTTNFAAPNFGAVHRGQTANPKELK